MRTFLVVFSLVGAAFLLATDANLAQDKKAEKKEVVLKGLVCCYKCELGKGAECTTVIQVKDKETKKDVLYFFDKESHKKWHDDICANAKKGAVTGFVKDVDKKKVISVKKVEYDK